MRNIRRYYIHNAEYFITILTKKRRKLFQHPQNCELLKKAFRKTQKRVPFQMRAFAILPDHLHALIRPVNKPEDISAIIGLAKRTFTQSAYALHPSLKGRQLWHPRFHDHIIRDEDDLKKHVDYIHFNPVKHGLVSKPEDYQNSSFRKFLELGEYETGWGHDEPENLRGMDQQIEPSSFVDSLRK